MAQRDRHIVVVDREFLRPVMTAVLGGERVEPPDCPAAFHRLQVLHETGVPGLKPQVDVQRQDMLRHRIEGEDIGAVEGVQRGGLQQDIPDVFVAGGIVLKQPVQRLLLVSIVFQFMPLGENTAGPPPGRASECPVPPDASERQGASPPPPRGRSGGTAGDGPDTR